MIRDMHLNVYVMPLVLYLAGKLQITLMAWDEVPHAKSRQHQAKDRVKAIQDSMTQALGLGAGPAKQPVIADLVLLAPDFDTQTILELLPGLAPLADGYNAVGDFDDDNEAEIVLVSSGQVRLLEHNGTVKWGPMAIPGGGVGGPPTIADYDNDGQPEIGVAGASRYAVFETDGSLKWTAVIQDSSSNRTGSSVFDFENDGAAEVVYSDETRLWVFRGTDGFALFQTSLSSCTWHEYPLVADVDGDNRAEILAVANNNCGFGPQRGVYVYGDTADSWVSTRQIWNQHTYHITNVNPDGTIPVIEENNWLEPGLNNFRLNTFGQTDDLDGDGIPDTIDACPATVLPENVPTIRLGTNRFADIDGDGLFDTTAPNGKGPQKTFTLEDTLGCSCEQIITAQWLGSGHTKFGCSISVMEDWISSVNP